MEEDSEINDVSLNPMQYGLLEMALREYDGPEMYWADEESDKSKFRQECATQIRSRIDRKVRREGMRGISLALSEEEYRVCVEALDQYQKKVVVEGVDELINHLTYFEGVSEDGS